MSPDKDSVPESCQRTVDGALDVQDGKATTAKKRSVRANTTAQTRILDANRPQAAGSKG
jgi:hypothetical protein